MNTERQFLVFWTAKDIRTNEPEYGSQIVTTNGAFPSLDECYKACDDGSIWSLWITGITPMSEQDINDWKQ